MTIAAYCRVSTTDQDCALQLRELSASAGKFTPTGRP